MPVAAQCSMCTQPLKRGRLRYCSRVCSVAGYAVERQLIVEAWVRGEIQAPGCNGNDGAGLARWARDWLIKLSNGECSLCGWDTPHPFTGTPPLEIDHIDGDRKNNFFTNVRVLCPNCHALTPTHRGHKNRVRA